MNTYILVYSYTEVFRIVKRVHYQNIYIAYTMRYTFPYVLSHRFCSEDGCDVFLQNSDTAYHSTISRCNITRSIRTRHIVITPLCQPIISHTATPHPSSIRVFHCIHQGSSVTLFRPHFEFFPIISFTKLRMCLLFPSDLHVHNIVLFLMSLQ